MRLPVPRLPALRVPSLRVPWLRVPSLPSLRRLDLGSLRDPGVQASLVLVGLAAVGFAMLGLAWRGAARTVYVPFQIPWVVSGGIAGLGLIGMALGALSIHLGRRQDAVHRNAVEGLVREAIELTERMRVAAQPIPDQRQER